MVDDIIVVIRELKVEYFCAMPLITIKQLSHELLSLQIKKSSHVTKIVHLITPKLSY